MQHTYMYIVGTVMFLHWLAGMIFIFYVASFVMLLREVLRPGVLWFLRNLNDQNFHPINEVHYATLTHSSCTNLYSVCDDIYYNKYIYRHSWSTLYTVASVCMCTDYVRIYTCTVEPLYSGHPWDYLKCPD